MFKCKTKDMFYQKTNEEKHEIDNSAENVANIINFIRKNNPVIAHNNFFVVPYSQEYSGPSYKLFSYYHPSLSDKEYLELPYDNFCPSKLTPENRIKIIKILIKEKLLTENNLVWAYDVIINYNEVIESLKEDTELRPYFIGSFYNGVSQQVTNDMILKYIFEIANNINIPNDNQNNQRDLINELVITTFMSGKEDIVKFLLNYLPNEQLATRNIAYYSNYFLELDSIKSIYEILTNGEFDKIQISKDFFISSWFCRNIPALEYIFNELKNMQRAVTSSDVIYYINLNPNLASEVRVISFFYEQGLITEDFFKSLMGVLNPDCLEFLFEKGIIKLDMMNQYVIDYVKNYNPKYDDNFYFLCFALTAGIDLNWKDEHNKSAKDYAISLTIPSITNFFHEIEAGQEMILKSAKNGYNNKNNYNNKLHSLSRNEGYALINLLAQYINPELYKTALTQEQQEERGLLINLMFSDYEYIETQIYNLLRYDPIINKYLSEFIFHKEYMHKFKELPQLAYHLEEFIICLEEQMETDLDEQEHHRNKLVRDDVCSMQKIYSTKRLDKLSYKFQKKKDMLNHTENLFYKNFTKLKELKFRDKLHNKLQIINNFSDVEIKISDYEMGGEDDKNLNEKQRSIFTDSLKRKRPVSFTENLEEAKKQKLDSSHSFSK